MIFGLPVRKSMSSQSTSVDISSGYYVAANFTHLVLLALSDTNKVKEPSGKISFKVATATVLTLYSQTKSGAVLARGSVSARLTAIRSQCYQAGYQTIGLQETGSKISGYKPTEHFHVLSSPADDQGRYGVQVSIARLPAYTSSPITETWVAVHGGCSHHGAFTRTPRLQSSMTRWMAM